MLDACCLLLLFQRIESRRPESIGVAFACNGVTEKAIHNMLRLLMDSVIHIYDLCCSNHREKRTEQDAKPSESSPSEEQP
jgi:hypothetical protein